MSTELWYKKHRPKGLDSFIFQNPQHSEFFQKFITEKTIPHLLMSGGSGLGKSAMARILIESIGFLDEDVFFLDGSSENNSVKFIRTVIAEFVELFPMGMQKLVYIEECDRLSPHAQDALRVIIGDRDTNTRFLLTCNHPQRLTHALKSRFQHIQFDSLNLEELTVSVAEILIKENVTFDLDVLDSFVNAHYPDARKIINTLQLHTYNGKLSPMEMTDAIDGEIETILVDALLTKNWQSLRIMLKAMLQDADWEKLYIFLYENIHNIKGFNPTNVWENAIILIAEHLHKNDKFGKELNFTSLMIQLANLTGE